LRTESALDPQDAGAAESRPACCSLRHHDPYSPGDLSSAQAHPHFLSRVTQIPLVHTGIRSITSLYECTKANSPHIVQRSAQVLESNLRPIGALAGKYLQTNQVVRDMDEFACRQLDRLESKYPLMREEDEREPQEPMETERESPSSASGTEAPDSANPGERPRQSGSVGEQDQALPLFHANGHVRDAQVAMERLPSIQANGIIQECVPPLNFSSCHFCMIFRSLLILTD
jgi:hypothetical protein